MTLLHLQFVQTGDGFCQEIHLGLINYSCLFPILSPETIEEFLISCIARNEWYKYIELVVFKWVLEFCNKKKLYIIRDPQRGRPIILLEEG